MIRKIAKKINQQIIKKVSESQICHYHWKNLGKNSKVIKGQERFDRYGRTCKEGSAESHLAPLDKDYIMK